MLTQQTVSYPKSCIYGGEEGNTNAVLFVVERALRSQWVRYHPGRPSSGKSRPHLLVQSVGHDRRRLVLLSIADGSDPQRNLRRQR